MPLRGRVGRHAQHGGRHCQNWPDDQQKVIIWLNHIPANDGGMGGRLNGNIGGRIVAGMASDSLYGAIVKFEDRHFPGQRSGFVDPGGKIFLRMMELAARSLDPPMKDPATAPHTEAPLPVIESWLDILRRHVLDERSSKRFTAGERVAFEPLVTMAVRHIDALKERGFERLPFDNVMFGRAHITKGKRPTMRSGSLQFLADEGTETLPLPEMRFGSPVDGMSDITTEKLGALLLFGNGVCSRIFPYHTGAIRRLGHIDPTLGPAESLRP